MWFLQLRDKLSRRAVYYSVVVGRLLGSVEKKVCRPVRPVVFHVCLYRQLRTSRLSTRITPWLRRARDTIGVWTLNKAMFAEVGYDEPETRGPCGYPGETRDESPEIKELYAPDVVEPGAAPGVLWESVLKALVVDNQSRFQVPPHQKGFSRAPDHVKCIWVQNLVHHLPVFSPFKTPRSPWRRVSSKFYARAGDAKCIIHLAGARGTADVHP
ncbi:hypothetical protein EDB81DRAFT_758359 [Dactylonectria macrodidyma]|uniref:Uncharacterized protein n=1 Tax=Dactylonectria macrodidyma TaxID=307937 RepID=A0A9P9F5P5_9HYPO|nr:hypothetical protein EDB81DRAFT_758359 [Dactylonectria macrodidyma]